MKQFGDEVILRDSARAVVLRAVAQAPERMYLVSVRDGSERIVAEGDLWSVGEYREWIQHEFNWDGVERRRAVRRRVESPVAALPAERRQGDRRRERLPVLQ